MPSDDDEVGSREAGLSDDLRVHLPRHRVPSTVTSSRPSLASALAARCRVASIITRTR